MLRQLRPLRTGAGQAESGSVSDALSGAQRACVYPCVLRRRMQPLDTDMNTMHALVCDDLEELEYDVKGD